MEKILEVLKRARINITGPQTANLTSEIDDLIKILERPNPSKEGFYYWILQVGIEKTWVADGIDFTDERLENTIQRAYGHLRGDEIKAKVLSRPPDKNVAQEMGFETVAKYIKDRGK